MTGGELAGFNYSPFLPRPCPDPQSKMPPSPTDFEAFNSVMILLKSCRLSFSLDQAARTLSAPPDERTMGWSTAALILASLDVSLLTRCSCLLEDVTARILGEFHPEREKDVLEVCRTSHSSARTRLNILGASCRCTVAPLVVYARLKNALKTLYDHSLFSVRLRTYTNGLHNAYTCLYA